MEFSCPKQSQSLWLADFVELNWQGSFELKVVIELGGNDGLRGQAPLLIQKNLAHLIQQSQKAKATVIVLGMKIPPNYGTAYSKAFEKNYKIVSQQYKVKLLPFFLEGIAGKKNLMQQDLVHPNANAQSILLNNAYPYIKGAL